MGKKSRQKSLKKAYRDLKVLKKVVHDHTDMMKRVLTIAENTAVIAETLQKEDDVIRTPHHFEMPYHW